MGKIICCSSKQQVARVLLFPIKWLKGSRKKIIVARIKNSSSDDEKKDPAL
jgi:hypothetical protein